MVATVETEPPPAPQGSSDFPFRLPLELMAVIGQQLDESGCRATLARLALACKTFNEQFTPVLYSRLIITRRTAGKLFQGLERKAPPKSDKIPTRAVREKHFDEFVDKFTHIWDQAEDGHVWRNVPLPLDLPYSPEWHGSEPETDDELPEEPRPVRSKKDWHRRLQLLAHCTHLTILQVPSSPLVTDLCSVLKPPINGHKIRDDEGMCDGERNGDNACPTKGVTAATRRGLILFPNLRDLAISHRVVQKLSDWDEACQQSTPTPPIVAMNESDRVEAPFARILKYRLGAPEHVCVTGVPGDEQLYPEALFRCLHAPPSEITNQQLYDMLHGKGPDFQARRDSRLVTTMKSINSANARSLTVHNVRYPCRPDMWLRYKTTGFVIMRPFDRDKVGLPTFEEDGVAYRYFYDDHPYVNGDTVDDRATAVARQVKNPVASRPDALATFEHVDIGRNVRSAKEPVARKTGDPVAPLLQEEEAQELIAEKAAAIIDATVQMFKPLDPDSFLPEDSDAELEAAIKRVKVEGKGAQRCVDSISRRISAARQERLEKEVEQAAQRQMAGGASDPALVRLELDTRSAKLADMHAQRAWKEAQHAPALVQARSVVHPRRTGGTASAEERAAAHAEVDVLLAEVDAAKATADAARARWEHLKNELEARGGPLNLGSVDLTGANEGLSSTAQDSLPLPATRELAVIEALLQELKADRHALRAAKPAMVARFEAAQRAANDARVENFSARLERHLATAAEMGRGPHARHTFKRALDAAPCRVCNQGHVSVDAVPLRSLMRRAM